MALDSEDLGDHEIAEATVHALIVAGENLATIARLLGNGGAVIETRDGGQA